MKIKSEVVLLEITVLCLMEHGYTRDKIILMVDKALAKWDAVKSAND